MRNGVPRILIIRLSAVGDVVRVLPALHFLRMAYPDARIDWAVEDKAADIVTGHPAIDEVLIFERSKGSLAGIRNFSRFCRQVRRNRYDMVLDFHGIFKSGFIARLSGARDRIGFTWPRSQEASAIFLTKKLRLPSERLNRVDENLALCEMIVSKRFSVNPTIYIPPDIQEGVDAFCEETFDGGKWVVAMHAPVDRKEKQWPVEYYAKLADLLLADGRFEVMLTWGPGQFQTVRQVLANARRNPIVAPETPGLKHYAWLAHRANLYVGGDTGPMHIASAMGTPVVAVFGGTDPVKHAPYRKPYEILWIDPERQGGQRTARLSAQERLKLITPEMAYDACVKIVFESRNK